MLVEEKIAVIRIKTIAGAFCAGSCPWSGDGLINSPKCLLFTDKIVLETDIATGLAIRCSKCVEATT